MLLNVRGMNMTNLTFKIAASSSLEQEASTTSINSSGKIQPQILILCIQSLDGQVLLFLKVTLWRAWEAPLLSAIDKNRLI